MLFYAWPTTKTPNTAHPVQKGIGSGVPGAGIID